MGKEAKDFGRAVVLGLIKARHHDFVVDCPDLAMAYVVQQRHGGGEYGVSSDQRRRANGPRPVRLASFLHGDLVIREPVSPVGQGLAAAIRRLSTDLCTVPVNNWTPPSAVPKTHTRFGNWMAE